MKKHKAPKGKLYVKDGVAVRTVVTKEKSDIIKSYKLTDEKKFRKEVNK